jgi:hypothetical protein
MSTEPFFEEAAGDLANEIAEMHGAMFNLIVRLYKTQLSPTQAALVSAADVELAVSQKRLQAAGRREENLL